jgi:LysM repeat protein
MTTYDHHQIASMLFKEAQLDRSNLKAIFDLSSDQLTLEQAIAIAHNSLSKHDYPDAIRKLLNFRNHYFIPVEYNYPENDQHKLQEITQHSVAVIQKWVDEIEKAINDKKNQKEQKKYKGFNRFIHRSVAALAKKLNQIEPLETRQQYFLISAYKINKAFIEYSNTVQQVIQSALAKICAQMGVTDALLQLNQQDGDYIYRASGVSLPLEIQNIKRVIDHAYQNYDSVKHDLKSPYKAQIARVISATRQRLSNIQNMDTRYDYLSKAKNAIEKAIKPYNENFIAIVLHYLDDLKDEQATEYRKHRNKAAKANNKAKIQLNINQAKEVFANVQSEMVQQMQPSRYQSWAKLCLSICLLTGRRIYEVCVTGKFEIINHNTLKMTGMAKQKNETDTETRSIEFTTYADANLIIWAIQKLRELKDFTAYGGEYEKFRKGTSTPLRHAVTGDTCIIKHDTIEAKLQPKMMRQFYAAMLKFDIQKQKPNESDNFYDHELAKHLGHNAETDIETVQSYKDIVIHD